MHFCQESGYKPGTLLVPLWYTLLLSAPSLEEFTLYIHKDCAVTLTKFSCQQNFAVFGSCDKFERSAEWESS